MKNEIEKIFNIDKFNILEDDKNYYFFRALNMADNKDLDENVITENGHIIKIRTDLQRFNGDNKYNLNDNISLEQVFDHIKPNYRKDTNCISLSSNANVNLLYGRKFYLDKYIMVKIDKNDYGKKVINAGQFLLENINSKIEEFILNNKLDKCIRELLEKIDNSKSEKEIQKIIVLKYKFKNKYKSKTNSKKEIKKTFVKIRKYNYLNEIQSLERNKIIAKLIILNGKANMSSLISNYKNNDLIIKTVENAFSSLEQIHYGEINKNEIIEISKEEMDLISLIQQVKDIDKKHIDDFKLELIKYILQDKKYNFSENLVLKKLNFQNNDILKKSREKCIEYSNILFEIFDKNEKYYDIITNIKLNGYTIEPEIFTFNSDMGKKISESVNLT